MASFCRNAYNYDMYFFPFSTSLLISCVLKVEFYKLKEARPLWGVRTMEANEFGIEIYEPCPQLAILPCLPVNEGGILGSSSTYYTRKNISKEVSGTNNSFFHISKNVLN